MKTYHKDFCGVSATITDKRDGTARLTVSISTGQKIHDKIHKNRKAALAAWRRLSC